MLQGKDILTQIQLKALAILSMLTDQENFYLTGGTALSGFYLGHRVSYDLDFFTTEEALVAPFSRQVESVFQKNGWNVQVIRRFHTYVEMLLGQREDEVRLDLAFDTPFRFAPPEISGYGVYVNDFHDLRAEKVLAYYGRAEPRDGVDLYFLLYETAITELISAAGQKDSGFDRYWFAIALNKSLEFPNELERWPVKMLKSFDPKDLKSRFKALALQLMEEITGGSK